MHFLIDIETFLDKMINEGGYDLSM